MYFSVERAHTSSIGHGLQKITRSFLHLVIFFHDIIWLILANWKIGKLSVQLKLLGQLRETTNISFSSLILQPQICQRWFPVLGKIQVIIRGREGEKQNQASEKVVIGYLSPLFNVSKVAMECGQI